jgi:hypothetical protein
MTKDSYDDIADAVAEVARLAAQMDDPNRNILGTTRDQLDAAKRRLGDLMQRRIADVMRKAPR